MNIIKQNRPKMLCSHWKIPIFSVDRKLLISCCCFPTSSGCYSKIITVITIIIIIIVIIVVGGRWGVWLYWRREIRLTLMGEGGLLLWECSSSSSSSLVKLCGVASASSTSMTCELVGMVLSWANWLHLLVIHLLISSSTTVTVVATNQARKP